MTTSDERTIRDGAADFYELSGGDLFALADGNGKPVALYEGGASRDPADLSQSLIPQMHGATQPSYVIVRGNLFEVAVQPLYFGAAASGTRLGYVLLGYSVDRRLAEEVSQATSAEVIFYADRAMVATTLDDRYQAESARRSEDLLSSGSQEGETTFGGEHFVHAAVLLSGTPEPRVQLVVLKSYDQASRYITHLNQVLVTLGAMLLLFSGALAMYLSTTITRPARSPGGRSPRAGRRQLRLPAFSARAPAKSANSAKLSIACAAVCAPPAKNSSRPSALPPSAKWPAPSRTTSATTSPLSTPMPSSSATTPSGRTNASSSLPRFARACAA